MNLNKLAYIVFILIIGCQEQNSSTSTINQNSSASGQQSSQSVNGQSTRSAMFIGVTFQSLTPSLYTTWEGQSGHSIHRVHQFFDFNTIKPLSTTLTSFSSDIDATLAAGYSLILTMEPTFGDFGNSLLPDISNGVFDPYIDAFITEVQSLKVSWPNADIWLRFGHEMNGDWYPWGGKGGHNGNSAATYISAWQHVVQRFRSANINSNMIKWVWSPNVWPSDNFSQYYPSDPYTDLISVSGFNFGPNAPAQPALTWQSFNTIHQFTYNTLTLAYPDKPYFIAGISSAESGGDKAVWIDDMTFNLLHNYPLMKGIVWFNIDKTSSGEVDWRIDSSPQSLASIQRMFNTPSLWLQ